jgi:hypothetical protein
VHTSPAARRSQELQTVELDVRGPYLTIRRDYSTEGFLALAADRTYQSRSILRTNMNWRNLNEY